MISARDVHCDTAVLGVAGLAKSFDGLQAVRDVSFAVAAGEMVASFNRGYRGFQQTYRSCTPAADIVIHRYLEEGAKIARDITARYAN